MPTQSRPSSRLKVDDSKQPQYQNEAKGNAEQPKNNGHNTPFLRPEVDKIGEEGSQRDR